MNSNENESSNHSKLPLPLPPREGEDGTTKLQEKNDDTSFDGLAGQRPIAPPQLPQKQRPWWKRHKKVLLTVGIVGVIVGVAAATVGAYYSSRSSNVPPECWNFVESIFETASACGDASNCSPRMAIDGSTVVVTKLGNIQFLSIVDDGDELEVVTTIDIDYYVSDVAISGDVVAVGAEGEDVWDGAVYLYERTSSGEWNLTMRISPPDDDVGRQACFGWALSMGDDVLVVGAPDLDNVGSAYIYQRRGATWELEQKLLPDLSVEAWFGYSVSVRGILIAVGDDYADYVHVYNFDSSSNSWVQLGEPLANDDCTDFGDSVALTDGNGLAIGCDSKNINTGAVYFYEQSRNGGKYNFKRKITASDGAPNHEFGGLHRISVDGDVMVVGTWIEANGKAYVFRKVNNKWVEVAILNSPSDSGAFFGDLVATSGNRILIASRTNVYAYKLESCG